MKIENNIIKHYLKNVYFVTGTAYAGKSTMVRELSKRYDLIQCGENYHSKVSDEVADPIFQPNLSYFKTMKDWQEYINRTPEEYDGWITGVAREAAQFEIAQLIRLSGERKVIVDTNIPLELLHEIADYDHVAVMLSPKAMSVERFFDREDEEKQFILRQIKKAEDPEKTMKNFKNCIAKVNSQEHYNEYVNSGFFTILRSNADQDSKEEMIHLLARHFRLEEDIESIEMEEVNSKDLEEKLLPKYEAYKGEISPFQDGINNEIYTMAHQGKVDYLRISPSQFRRYEDIEAEIRLLKALEKENVNVAMPIAMKNGSYITRIQTVKGVRYAVLFEDAGGETKGIKSQEELMNLGALLAKVHEVTKVFSVYTKLLDTAYFIDEPMKVMKKCCKSATILGELNQIAETMHQYFEVYRNESYGIFHADPHNYNIRYDKANPKLFDFDSFGYGPQMYDLGEQLWNIMMFELPEADEKQQFSWLLEGYEHIRPLSRAMKESTLYYAALRDFRLMGVQLASELRKDSKSCMEVSVTLAHINFMRKILKQLKE